MTTPIPPIDWFRSPNLDGPTPLTIGDDGRVYGHLALWGTRHTGMAGRITPPHSRTDYAGFHVGAARVADGGRTVTISVGSLTMGTGHAATHLDRGATLMHYDHSGSIAAQVCAGEDAHGVWFAGALMPDIDELRARRFAACALSGDWRFDPDSGGLELCAALAVPCPGFPIPRARVASGAPLALVAAGAVAPGLAAFTRRIPDGWTPKKTSDRFSLTSFSPAHLADMVADRLDRRRRDAELAATQSALVGDLDDTAALTASLLESVDDSAAREAALLAELDDTGTALEALAQNTDGSFLSRMPPQLRESYLTGKAAAKIQWGTPGDFARCEAEAAHHGIPEHERAGMCSDLHQEALGVRPGQEKG